MTPIGRDSGLYSPCLSSLLAGSSCTTVYTHLHIPQVRSGRAEDEYRVTHRKTPFPAGYLRIIPTSLRSSNRPGKDPGVWKGSWCLDKMLSSMTQQFAYICIILHTYIFCILLLFLFMKILSPLPPPPTTKRKGRCVCGGGGGAASGVNLHEGHSHLNCQSFQIPIFLRVEKKQHFGSFIWEGVLISN